MSTATNEISSAAQSLKISENVSPTPKTKGSSSAPILDSSAEHLPFNTKIAGNLAKTLVDQQTAGADMISSTFCTLHNLLLHPLQTHITLQMTMKGSKGSISHYTKAIIDWLRWSEEWIFYVAAHKDWDIIVGSPALRHTKALINMGTNSDTIQSLGQQRFILQPWISKPAQNIRRQKEFASNVPQVDQLAPHLPKLAKDHPLKIFSVSTTLTVPPTPFDEYL